MKGGDYIVNIKVIGANCSNGMKILKNLSKVERELDMEFNIEKIDSTYKKKMCIRDRLLPVNLKPLKKLKVL